MPYIKQEERAKIDPLIKQLTHEIQAINSMAPDGALNYTFTQLLRNTLLAGKPGYILFERAVGVLECCKLELYRRAAAPYENLKVRENGDVYNYIEGGQLPQAPPT